MAAPGVAPPTPCSSSSSRRQQAVQSHRLPLYVALVAMCATGFADMYSYSMPVTFLGQVLTKDDASSATVMLALGLDGICTCATAILVLLCQSIPVISRMSVGAKWWMVILGQATSVLSSLLPVVSPTPEMVTACRALHGAATAVYMIYCLILLVELAPKQRLALGIAALSAGCSAGDSIGPVLGAVVFDRGGGLRSAFLLQAAVNAVPLLLALLVVPLWVLAGKASSRTSTSTNASSNSIWLVRTKRSLHGSNSLHGMLPTVSRMDSCSSCCIDPHGDGMPLPGGYAKDAAAGDTSTSTHCITVPQPDATHWGSTDRIATAADTESVRTAGSSCGGSSIDASFDIPHTDSRNIWSDSAHDMNALRSTAAPSSKQTDVSKDVAAHTSVDTTSTSDGGSWSVSAADKSYHQQEEMSESTQSQQDAHDHSTSLGIRSVLSTVADPVVFSQCLLALLETAATGLVAVLVPAVMGVATWLVGVIFITMAAGAVVGPFALEAYLSRTSSSKHCSYQAACVTSLLFGICGSLLVPFSWCLPALCCLLFVFGATQAATETLVYINVARRLDALGKHVATHVSMAMFISALALGAGLGNMVGGALQSVGWAAQVGVACAVAGTTGVYGAGLSLVMLAKQQER